MTAKNNKIIAWIVPETHWDREWVMTQGQFQVRLTDMVDNLIEICEKHSGYHFYFDGQTIALEDYLEVRPENRLRLRKLIKAKQIVTGPWYGLADQFMQGGEATIRNLLEGRRGSLELGGAPLLLGYVPDSFGSSSALPMILREFGISFAIVGRGRARDLFESQHNEFIWESASGDAVLAADFNYSGGNFLSYPDIRQDIRRCHPEPESTLHRFMETAEKQLKTAADDHLYFPVGVDHMEARESLIEIIEYINKHQNTYELKFGMPTDYLCRVKEAARNLDVYRGELCGSDKSPMNLNGTLSSHVRLKQANFRCEKLLAGAVEPLAVLAERFAGKKYPEGMLRKMWKLLLANQTHDSICGCSIDQVHRDMMFRFNFIENTSAYLLKDAAVAVTQNINTIGREPDAPAITVFNPLCRERHVPIRAMVAVPKRCSDKNYVLTDASGNPVAATVTYVATKKIDLESVYMTPEQLAVLLSKDAPETWADDQVFTIFEIDFIARSLPMCGWKTWWLTPLSDAVIQEEVHTTTTSIENEFLRVELLSNGSFDLTDLQTGHCFRDVMRFADREEAGDLYDHVALPEINEVNTSSLRAEILLTEKLPHRATYKITIPFAVPAKIEGKTRSSRSVDMPITLFVSLSAGIPRLELTVECENVAKDHCLHAIFASGIKTGTVESDVAFDVISRKVDIQEKIWRHRPMQNFVDVSDGTYGLCVMTKGLYSQLASYANTGTADIHITLLRCAGRLGAAAGADYETPDGQCQGKHRFEMALMPHSGDWQTGKCGCAAMDFSHPACIVASLPHEGTLPGSDSAIATSDTKMIVSCLKKAETGQKTIFRCWNSQKTDIIESLSGQLLSGQQVSMVHADETLIKKTNPIIRTRNLLTLRL